MVKLKCGKIFSFVSFNSKITMRNLHKIVTFVCLSYVKSWGNFET